ncbi:MAG: ral nucleoside transport system permease protein [Solirubrobacteraceae bacterium]|jgi:simple sugar transport system permease protein|nr:ral nucleoside transport system permease protein [Solirubrobacteraceae bacterium]
MSGAEGPASLTVGSRLSGYLRGGGIITPLLTALIAFFIGGLVVALTGANPFTTYKAIFDGSGLNWLFPWISADDRMTAGLNLQQTLLLTTPLIFTGLAVAYAFRAGLFNIGGQGQYFAGLFIGVWVGSSLHGLPAFLHILLALVLGTLAGAVWGGIAGFLKATTGSNEVITTIMLNYVILWAGVWAFGLGGPLHSGSGSDKTVPISDAVVQNARLPVFWGDPELQGLHIGIFFALAALVVFWVLLNRSVAGYEARAVGFSPDAAEYGGIHAGRTYTKVMLVCGAFAGLAGVIDILGWQFAVATNDIQNAGAVGAGFIGIAVALLGRNTTTGVFFSALLFGALINGTSVRNLDPAVFPPELATNLTLIIQGLIVLLVSAPVIVTAMYKLRPRRGPLAEDEADA